MSSVAKYLPMIRLVSLSVTSVAALIVLAVNGHYSWTTMNTELSVNGFAAWPQTAPDAFSALNLAVGVMTLLTVPAMIVVDLLRRGAFTSMILLELAWLGFLDIIWLAASAYTSSIFPPLGALCSENSNISNLVSACGDTQASMAFSWIIWLILTAYLSTLLAMAIISANNARPVWKDTVKTADFAAGKAASSGYAMPPMQQQAQSAYAMPYDPPMATGYGSYAGGAQV